MKTRFLLSVFFTLLLMAMPKSVWADNYISEIKVSNYAKEADAYNSLNNSGYKVFYYNLNRGASKGDWVLIGYKVTTDPTKALTNLVLSKGGKFSNGQELSDGRKYYQCPTINSGNINKNSGGEELYLYYTTDDPQLGVITDLQFSKSGQFPIPFADPTSFMIGGVANFNSGNDGENCGISMQKTVADKDNSPVTKMENAFKVQKLGGGLYHLTIPLGARNGRGTEYILGGGNDLTTLELRYRPKGGNYTKFVGINNVNNELKDCCDDWGYWFNYNNAFGQFYDLKQSSWITKSGTVFSYQRNEEVPAYDQGHPLLTKNTSLIWYDDKHQDIEAFQIYSYGVITQSSVPGIYVYKSGVEPIDNSDDGINNINATDPMLDFFASKDSTNKNPIGTQTVNIMTASQMKTMMLFDTTLGKCISTTDVPDGAKQLALSIPSDNRHHDMVAVMFGNLKVQTDDGLVDTCGWYGAPFTLKPFHAISSMKVTPEKGVDKSGSFTQVNKIQWTVEYPSDEDVMSMDEYVVQRAQKADFSDAYAIGNISVSETDPNLVTIVKQSDGKEIGTYTFEDNYEGNSYNKLDSVGTGKLYYRVVRAVVMGNWIGCDMGNYAKTDSMVVNNYLAGVDRITLRKADTFETESKVKVRVELGASSKFESGKTPNALFDIFRNAGNRADTYSNSYYYIISAKENKYLAIEDGKVGLSDVPFWFYTPDGYALRGENDQYISWDNANPTNLIVGERSKFTETCTKRNYPNGTSAPSFFSFYHTVDGQKYYLADGKYSTEDYKWNIVVRTRKDDATAAYRSLEKARQDSVVWDSNASVVIKRYSLASEHYEGRDLVEKTITIKGNEVKWDDEKRCYYAEIEDIQSTPFTHYYYKAAIDNRRSNYRMVSNDTIYTNEAEADDCYRETLAPVANLRASMGTHKGRVVVEWDTDEGVFDNFKVERRDVALKTSGNKKIVNTTNNNAYEKQPMPDSLATHFVDEKAESGTLYEYRVSTELTVRGKYHVTANASTFGWNPYLGAIKGRVTLKNNARMPSSVTVKIKGQTAVDVDEVRDAQNDTIIIPGYHEVYEDSLKTINGTFEFDSIPYMSNGTKYNIDVLSSGADFVLEGQGDDKNIAIMLEDKMYEYNALHYICNDTRQFSGRVLYENSTIPVRDCQFLMNGDTVLDANGKPVVTDSKGEFMFLLPRVRMTLKVMKPGHGFADEAYILPREEDIVDKKVDAHEFVPNENYDGLILTDTTKVRLVGRLTGGNKQGKLPLGMALSKNNLGDNLRMVLELEGDNTSRITYFKENPDRSSYTQQFTQSVMVKSVAEEEHHELIETRATFEKKRIIVEPDVTTGEFCIDLAPTKYKITEMSATGYSTLFNEGEGFQVLEITNDTTLIKDTLTYRNEGIKADETRATAYNAKYQRVIHNPVTITYDQYMYGMKQNILGTQRIRNVNYAGETKMVDVARYDKETKTTHYTFEKPVFVSGERYDYEVRAHEDYFYNCDKSSIPDIVYIEGGMLKVRNELVSSVSDTQYSLDGEGRARFSFVANNPEFSVKKEDALRYLTMQVETNGYYYEAKPLEAYVTGVRDKGSDVMTFDGSINVFDVIRDPYGSGSYAYREAGTQYHWDYNFDIDFSLGVNLGFETGSKSTYFTGIWAGVGMGNFTGTPMDGSSVWNFGIDIPILSVHSNEKGTYDMTLKDKVSTSSNSLDVGAMADVYIGTVNTYKLSRVESFSLIDADTYKKMKPAVESGAIRIIQEGENEKKEKVYLAISEKLKLDEGAKKDFVYTQKHIVGTILPQLAQTLESMLLEGDSTEIQRKADATGKVLYWLKSEHLANDTAYSYKPIYPHDAAGNVLTDVTPEIDPQSVISTMKQWVEIVAANEQKKYETIHAGKTPFKQYSLSSATSIDHSESASAYFRPMASKVTVGPVTVYDEIADTGGEFATDWSAGWAESMGKVLSQKVLRELTLMQQHPEDSTRTQVFSLDIMGYFFKLKVLPSIDLDFNRNKNKQFSRSAGSGYVLATNDNSYLDIDVYREDQYGRNDDFVGAFFTDDDDKNADHFWDKLTDVKENEDEVKAAKVNDFVFTTKGGAERQPWYEPDSTMFYRDAYKNRLPLTERTLRIDNPKISISNPVVSNLPVGEKAIFSVRLTNDSEVTSNMDKSLMNASFFKLFLDDKSSSGAVVSMDGMPITEGRSIKLKPGESITKTIEVGRAGTAYDLEDIRLGFRDEANSLVDYAAISVHYLPASTPLKMTRPVDKWVMNTLSAKDEQGRYYIPVEVTDFNTQYDNFDHIELQYKKKTEGDSKWVNMCSFYADVSLYNAASGTKEMLTNGTIQYRFYGEADPMEMEYDLRAVSFCRLGTGFVSAVSNVMSGRKDTRCPEIFGKPKPTNGVLTFEDVISFPFNEPIAYNYLDKTANFQITGLTNNLERKYDTALRFPAFESDKPDGDRLEEIAKQWSDVPVTKVNRSLAGLDFTWDAMVKMDKSCDIATLFSMIDGDASTSGTTRYFALTYEKGQLMASMNGISYMSENIEDDEYKDSGLSLYNKETHVAVTFVQDSVGVKNQLKFYLDGIEIPVKSVTRLNRGSDKFTKPILELPDDEVVKCDAYGKISIGKRFVGTMVDIRLWDKALSKAELESKKSKTLSKTEPSLMCYWPVDEMTGNVLHDKVNGTDMYFSRQTWDLTTGQHSLKLDGEGVRLQNTETAFMRSEYTDFTLSFWLQMDRKATVADSVTIFNGGSLLDDQHFAIYLNKEDMMLKSGTFETKVAKRSDMVDDAWHLLTVVTNKSYNTSSVYVDGKLTVAANGSDLCGMPAGVSLGDENFHGGFDNLSFWHLAMPASSLAHISNVTPTGREMGLAYFMPFEKDSINSQGLHESVFSPYNMIIKKDEEGNEIETYDYALPQDMLTEEKLALIDDALSYPPVRSYGNIQNIPFTWTATDNELQVNLNIRDAEINHQYVNVTVRDVEDLAGNTLVSPQTMMVYVDRNVLNWDDHKIDVEVSYGEKQKVKSKLINKSGRSIMYNLVNNCSWLKLSQKDGTALPLSYDDIEMEISDGLAPGEYSTKVYVIDEDDLSSSLSVNVTVKADEPEWTVTTDAAYKYSMSLMGRVRLNNDGGMEYFDTDTRDIVAAFCDGVCVGKANIVVNEDNTPSVNMTIYGNESMMKNDSGEIIFQLWNAATNTVGILRPDNREGVIPFVNNSLVGCPPAEPVIFLLTDEVKQTISLETGWNWVSFNVIPKCKSGINGLFDSNNVFTVGDIVMHNNVAVELTEDSRHHTYVWSHEKEPIRNDMKYTYQIYVHKPTKATVFGNAYVENDRYVTLDGNRESATESRWCDLAYLLTVNQPINLAMSDFTSYRAQVGTIIKNRKEFAVMNDNGNWVGSLQYMRPGDGYFVKYFGQDTIQVKYINNERTTFAKRQNLWTANDSAEMSDDDSSAMWDAALFSPSVSESRTMMPVIADVDETVDLQYGDEIVAFSKGNIVGRAGMTQMEDGKQLFFISLNAENGDVVRFAHVRDNKIIGKSSNGLSYDGDGVTGTLHVPFTIDFSKSSSSSDDAYGIGGEIYGKASNLKHRHGIYIIGKEKVAK